MKKRMCWVLLAIASILPIAVLGSCKADPSVEIFTLSGTLSKTGIVDGIYAYTKLVAHGGDGTDPALYSVRSGVFSSGAATYAITDIQAGTYTQWTFIDVNGNAAGDATSMPDAGDWSTPFGNDVVIDADRTSDIGDATWVKI